MKFHDFPGPGPKFHDFPGLESKLSNSMTFQVFQDRYEPCKCAGWLTNPYSTVLSEWLTKGRVFCRNVFVINFGASGPGVRSIKKFAQWHIDFSCVGIVKRLSVAISRRSARVGHWSCCKSTVTLIPGPCRYSLYTNLAALRWTPSSLLISPTWCGSQMAQQYSNLERTRA